MSDILELGSFILMVYSAAIAFAVARKAVRFGGKVLAMSILLGVMLLSHGVHHAFAYFGFGDLEAVFEFLAALFALSLAVMYVRAWVD